MIRYDTKRHGTLQWPNIKSHLLMSYRVLHTFDETCSHFQWWRFFHSFVREREKKPCHHRYTSMVLYLTIAKSVYAVWITFWSHHRTFEPRNMALTSLASLLYFLAYLPFNLSITASKEWRKKSGTDNMFAWYSNIVCICWRAKAKAEAKTHLAKMKLFILSYILFCCCCCCEVVHSIKRLASTKVTVRATINLFPFVYLHCLCLCYRHAERTVLVSIFFNMV